MKQLALLLAVLAIALLTGCSTTPPSNYVWRLTEQEAITAARVALAREAPELSRLPVREIRKDAFKQEWTIWFSPPSPAPVDSDAWVTVNDRTRKTECSHGA